MPALSDDKNRLQKHHAARAICVRFQDNPQTVKQMYDNQWAYRSQGKQGYDPAYWDAKLRKLVRGYGSKVLEASIHDVSQGAPSTENKIAQLVSNGHILF